jgi:glycerol-3-phosphate acyltransferase PlsY
MLLIALPLVYLIAAIPFSLLISRWQGIDLLSVGSGNLGATNVYRVMGAKWGIIVFVLDWLKGFLPLTLVMLVWPYSYGLHVILAFFAVFAHSYSVFVKFKGGKGAATGLGVVAALHFPTFLLVFLIGIGIIYWKRIVSIATIAGCILIPLFLFLFDKPGVYILGMLGASSFIIYRHKANILRLKQGTENKL